MRHRSSSLAVVLAALLASAARPAAPPVEDPRADPRTVKADAVFARFDHRDSPGCALAVVRDGRVAYARGYGMASLELAVPITPLTVFDIGSTSKQFTAASVLLLAQEGKLSLDDEVRKFLPELPALYAIPGSAAGASPAGITLRHLLHHTSGLRDYINLMILAGARVEDVTTDEDALAMLARQKALNFSPGRQFSYSNTGYFLLSQVVKRVSGKTLAEFAAERLFRPLAMNDTLFLDDHARVVPRRASAYAPAAAGGYRTDLSNWEQTGDGAVNTTVLDLAKWDQNFYQPRVGGEALIAQLTTTGSLAGGEKIDYARGLVVDQYRGSRRVRHGGSWAGYRAELLRFPEQRFSVITLCNLATADPAQLADQVADIYLAERLAAPPAAAVSGAAGPGSGPGQSGSPAGAAGEGPAASRPAPPLAEAEAARFTGLYWEQRGDRVRRVLWREGKLLYVRGEGGGSELLRIEGSRFTMMAGAASAEVTFPPASDDARWMRVVVPGEQVVFTGVVPVAPSPSELAAFAGSFYCPELDATYKLTSEDGALRLHARGRPARSLEPLFADAFRGPGLDLLRFERREQGRVFGFALSAGGALRLQCKRSRVPTRGESDQGGVR
ncbi:MAG TPA: serine hydrolase domain-containing protein [Thermoanaerobaculia bacterium]|nr:serine hydrolase domain-containing protein [Thermoanaerobaculia bacterium]